MLVGTTSASPFVARLVYFPVELDCQSTFYSETGAIGGVILGWQKDAQKVQEVDKG